MNETNAGRREIALIIGVHTPDQPEEDFRESLDELALLTDTAGADVAGRVVQNLPRIQSSTYVGSGKVKEIAAAVEKYGADLLVVNDDLSTVQTRNLNKELQVEKINLKIVDRSGLILDIFARRARSSQARAQVELAQLEYLRSRLTRAWTHLERQKGGIGMRGPGETQIETDRRMIGKRISVLKEHLQKVDQQRTTQRKSRTDQTRVALVGYTNAGKSTLMNTMSDAGVLAEDRLFATLDATTRQIALAPNKPVLLADTVGFIRKLPHALVESFKSTLDEVREADVLLHVVDITHRAFEDHVAVVRETLAELGASDKPTLMVYNKVDALDDPGVIDALTAEAEAAGQPAVFVSAARGIGLDRLRETTLGLVEADYSDHTALLPMSEAKSRAYLHSVAEILAEDAGLATDAFNDAAPVVPVFRVRYRASAKNAPDLDRMLGRFDALRWAEPDPASEPSGDGADASQEAAPETVPEADSGR
ncbi:MAG TPA: GTPase HflX [Rubricoccaceae bacterium]